MLDSTKALMDAKYGSLDYKAKLSWHQTNLKLLQENKAYIATWEEYKEWVKERNVITRNKYLTKVKNLKKKGGEEVLPKYYRTKLGITGSLADIKNKGSKHFEALITARVNLHPDINLSEYTSKNSPNTFAVSLGDVDIVFYHDPDAQMHTNAIIETVGQKQHLTTTEGDTFDQFNVRGLDASFNIVTREKGKSTIYVNLHNSTDLSSYKYVEGLLKRIPERSIKGVHAGDPQQYIWNRVKYENSELLISPDNTLPDWIDKTNSILDENLEKEANKTYNSFLLSLKTISARIPSQSYQSFLSNETVAFTDGEENNGYMNLWEMWF